jgi:hypothetical protein
MTIIETQNPTDKNKDGKVRLYEINGPSVETVASFWDWLKSNGTIQDYEVRA